MQETITPAELEASLAAPNAPRVLDVRRKADREADPTALPVAQWRDPEQLDAWAGELKPGDTAVIYCVRGGSVSKGVSAALRARGVGVQYVEGGLEAWKKEHPRHPRIREADVQMLKDAGMNAEDLEHSILVARRALGIAERVAAGGGAAVDLDLVARGALFHDLGKVVTHKIEHGRIGAEMGAKLGLPPEVTAVMEKHIRGGLTAQEAQELDLPVKDYGLHRLEERIIIYADRLVDIDTEGEVRSLAEAEARFEDILRTIPRYGKNEITMNRYLGYHKEIQGHMAGRSHGGA